MPRLKTQLLRVPYRIPKSSTSNIACPPEMSGVVSGTARYDYQSDVIKGDHKTPLPYTALFLRAKPGKRRTSLGSFPCGYPTENFPVVIGAEQFSAPQYCSWINSVPGTILGAIHTSAPPDVRSNARQQALSRIHVDKLELSTELLEFRSSLRTLGDLAKDLSSLANMVNKTGNGFIEASVGFRRYKDIFDPRDRKKLLKMADPAQKWLMLQFGLKPIVDSASKIISRLSDDEFFKDKLIITTSGRSKTDYISKPRIDQAYNRIDSGKIFYRIGMKYRISNPTMYKLSSLGLSPFDVVKSIYDVIPWSFLVEWGFGFGRALRGISATSGLTALTGYETTFNKGVSSWENNALTSLPLMQYACMTRNTITSIPPPDIFRGVDYLGSWHAITGAALASTTVARYRAAKITGN